MKKKMEKRLKAERHFPDELFQPERATLADRLGACTIKLYAALIYGFA